MQEFFRKLSSSFKDLVYLLVFSLFKSSFYHKVYSEFKGYGFMYLFTLSYIGALICTLILVIRLDAIKQYFDNKIVTTKETALIELILANWQPFYYDGKFISTDQDGPSLINNQSGRTIVAIDSREELTGVEREQIPIIFSKSNLLIGISDDAWGSRHVPYSYSNIFSAHQSGVIVDVDLISSICRAYSVYFEKILIYLFFPFLVIIDLLTLSLEKVFLVILIYFSLKTIISVKATAKSAIRIICFSCGVPALLIPLTILYEDLRIIINFAQIWTSGLIVYMFVLLGQDSKNSVSR